MNVLISTFGPFSPLPLSEYKVKNAYVYTDNEHTHPSLRKELNPKIFSTLQSVIVNASTASARSEMTLTLE